MIHSFAFQIDKTNSLIVGIEESKDWENLRSRWKGHKDRKKKLQSIFEVKIGGQTIAMFGLEKKGFKRAGLTDYFDGWNIVSFTGYIWVNEKLLQVHRSSYERFRSEVLTQIVEYLRCNGYNKKRVDIITELTLLGVTEQFKRKISAMNQLSGWCCLGVGLYTPNTYAKVQSMLKANPETNIAEIEGHKGVTTFCWINPDFHPYLTGQIIRSRIDPQIINNSFHVFPAAYVNQKLTAVSLAYPSNPPSNPWNEEARQLFYNLLARPTKNLRNKLGMR